MFPRIVRDVLRSRSKKFYNTGMQRLTQRWQTCVENEEDFMEKYLITAKEVRIMHADFVVTAIKFSEKKLEALLSYLPS
jgi:hypothetical protein